MSPITAISDMGTMYLTAHVNNIPGIKVFLNQVRALNPLDQTEKRLAMRAGLMVHTMTADISRFSTDTAGPRWSAKMTGLFLN